MHEILIVSQEFKDFDHNKLVFLMNEVLYQKELQ
jgi:hypothetical protein